MEDQSHGEPSKQDEIRAKQAISPAGLGNQSVEGTSGPIEMDIPDENRDMQEDDENVDAPTRHPNRNYNKPKLDRPSYS